MGISIKSAAALSRVLQRVDIIKTNRFFRCKYFARRFRACNELAENDHIIALAAAAVAVSVFLSGTLTHRYTARYALYRFKINELYNVGTEDKLDIITHNNVNKLSGTGLISIIFIDLKINVLRTN